MRSSRRVLPLLGVALLLVAAACAPAAPPPPTAAPPQPAPTVAPTQPAVKAEPQPTAKPAQPPQPTPAPKPEATAAAKPAAKPDTKALEQFYTGKTLRIIVGFPAGGGFDTYSRLIARHLGKHIPGNPNVIVENMPGAGSLVAANHMYNAAPKDGTVIGNFIGGLITKKILTGDPAAEFDPARFNWLGVPVVDTPACAVRKESGFTSLEQAREKELILGGAEPGSTTDDIPRTLRAALGLKIKVIDGYGGTAPIRLAADRGEIHGGCWAWESIKATWKDAIGTRDVLIIAQGGTAPHAELKDVPMMQSYATTDEARKLIAAGITAPGQVSRPYTLPPGVPQERVAALSEAFLSALKDRDLLADAQKGNIDIVPVSAAEVHARIKDIQELSPELKQKLKVALYETP